MFYFLVGFVVSKLNPTWGFDPKKVGTFGEWSAAIGATAVIAYMEFQHFRNKKDQRNLVINDLLVEVKQNQKRLNPDGIYASLNRPMICATDALTSIWRISDELDINVKNLVDAVLHDAHFRNAAINQNEATDNRNAARNQRTGIIFLLNIGEIDNYVRQSLNVLKDVLEKYRDGIEDEAIDLASKELIARDGRHKQYMKDHTIDNNETS